MTLLENWPTSDRNAASLAIAEHYAAYVEHAPESALARDETNIAGALTWAHAEGQGALVVRICLAMQSFWYQRGRVAAIERFIPWGIQAAKTIAQATGVRQDRLHVAQLDFAYASILNDTSDFAAAEKALLANLALRRELEDQQGAGEVLCALSDVASNQGDMDRSELYSQQALLAFQAAQDLQGEGRVKKDLAILALMRGEYDDADTYSSQALAIARDAGDRWTETEAIDIHGSVALRQGKLADAESDLLRALEMSRKIGMRWLEFADLRRLGLLEIYKGNLQEADQYLEQALKFAKELQSRQGEGVILLTMGKLAWVKRQLPEAQAYYARSLDIARQIHNRSSEGIALFGLGLVAEEQGDGAEGEHLLRQGLAIAREVRWGPEIAESCLALGRLLIKHNINCEEGCALLQESFQRYAKMGMPEAQEASETLQRLGCTEYTPSNETRLTFNHQQVGSQSRVGRRES